MLCPLMNSKKKISLVQKSYYFLHHTLRDSGIQKRSRCSKEVQLRAEQRPLPAIWRNQEPSATEDKQKDQRPTLISSKAPYSRGPQPPGCRPMPVRGMLGARPFRWGWVAGELAGTTCTAILSPPEGASSASHGTTTPLPLCGDLTYGEEG